MLVALGPRVIFCVSLSDAAHYYYLHRPTYCLTRHAGQTAGKGVALARLNCVYMDKGAWLSLALATQLLGR